MNYALDHIDACKKIVTNYEVNVVRSVVGSGIVMLLLTLLISFLFQLFLLSPVALGFFGQLITPWDPKSDDDNSCSESNIIKAIGFYNQFVRYGIDCVWLINALSK